MPVSDLTASLWKICHQVKAKRPRPIVEAANPIISDTRPTLTNCTRRGGSSEARLSEALLRRSRGWVCPCTGADDQEMVEMKHRILAVQPLSRSGYDDDRTTVGTIGEAQQAPDGGADVDGCGDLRGGDSGSDGS